MSQVWNVLSTVIAPATLVTALLFYFGYVSARSLFAYFGLDVDVLGYGTQEFVMRAPQPLLVPALILLLAAAGLTWLNSHVRRRLRSARSVSVRRFVASSRWVGATLLAAGLFMLLTFPALSSWRLYPLVTPLLLAAGAGLLGLSATWLAEPPGIRRSTDVLLVLVVVACVFWATATVAQWSGTGQAKALARDLTLLPAVVIDTRDALIPRDPAVIESTLASLPGESYHFRYRGLRLLAEGEGRLYLVPERWSSAGSTYVVSFDDARVRFRFVNDPP